MEIKAADVAKLRAMTGAGMMDCKKALVEAEGDFDRAQDIIREKGKLVAAKRADRTATQGVVASKIVGQKGYMLCLACETDFVAQNADFVAATNAILDIAVEADAADLDALLAVEIDKEVAKDVAMQAAAMAPVSIDKGDCDPKIIEHERMIGREQARQEGKPEAMLDKIAEGKVNKFLKENTLLNQDLVKNNKISVGTYIKEADKDATVIAYKRFSLND